MDDAHAWNAMAYVELNPLRAGMVRNPWDYPWSSASAHCGKGADAAGVLSLDAWRDEVTPKHWRDTLSAFAKQTGHHELLRVACRTGRPLGDATFLSMLEAYLGHRLPCYGRGRPKGTKDNRPRKPRAPKGEKEEYSPIFLSPIFGLSPIFNLVNWHRSSTAKSGYVTLEWCVTKPTMHGCDD
jgi:putative transposase